MRQKEYNSKNMTFKVRKLRARMLTFAQICWAACDMPRRGGAQGRVLLLRVAAETGGLPEVQLRP